MDGGVDDVEQRERVAMKVYATLIRVDTFLVAQHDQLSCEEKESRLLEMLFEDGC